MANIESVKVYFDTQKIEQTNEIADIKILMLKGEKGDTVSAQWGTITGTLSNQEDLNEELTTMAGNISTNASDILSLNTRVGADESSISDIDSRVTTNTSNISTLDGKVTTNTSNISSLGSRVTTVETDMGNYDTRITTNTNNITELDGRVTTNSNNIAGLVVNTLTGDETTKAPSVNAVNDALDDVNTALAAKQDTLVSGTNIKTINSTSLLGSGNISIEENQVIVSPTEPSTDRKKVWLRHSSNLFDKNNYISTSLFVGIGGTSYQTASTLKGFIFNVSNYTTITISKISSQRFGISASTGYPTSGGSATFIHDVDNQGTELTVDVTNYNYIVVNYYSTTLDTLTEQQILDTIQIELGTEATTYEPYVDDKEYILNENDVYEEFIPQNEIYSTNEVRIGTWINGKPLYRKVYNFTTSTVTSFNNIAEILNIDIKNFGGKLKGVSNGNQYPIIGFHSSSGNNSMPYTSGTALQYYVSDYQTQYDVELIIEYTKTTD